LLKDVDEHKGFFEKLKDKFRKKAEEEEQKVENKEKED